MKMFTLVWFTLIVLWTTGCGAFQKVPDAHYGALEPYGSCSLTSAEDGLRVFTCLGKQVCEVKLDGSANIQGCTCS